MKILETILQQKANRLKGRRKRLVLPTPPKPRPPTELERRYFRDIRKLVIGDLMRMVNRYLLPQLPDLMREATRELPVQDSADVRRDNYGRTVELLFAGLRVQYARALTRREVDDLAKKYAEEGEDWNRKQLAAGFERVLAVNPLVAEPYLTPIMTEFTAKNTSLIRSIGDEFWNALEQDTFRFVNAGVYNKEYAKRIQGSEFGGRSFAEELEKQYNNGVLKRRVKNVEARAKLIARDQISKYNGQLNQTRQSALGINKYRWVTVGDERVRDSHKQLNGKIFSWDNPPSVGHPGEDYQCRCIAQMVVDDSVTDNPELKQLLNS